MNGVYTPMTQRVGGFGVFTFGDQYFYLGFYGRLQ
jgi:hypothetical protein